METALWLGDSGVAATVAKAQAAQAATGRFTQPDEVADVVVLLASGRAGGEPHRHRRRDRRRPPHHPVTSGPYVVTNGGDWGVPEVPGVRGSSGGGVGCGSLPPWSSRNGG